MADFTTTTLATTPLLETTFISDMRIIVNANTTVLKSKIEDIINTLQIDLVNKYIGANLPIGRISTQEVYVSSSLYYKDGTSGSANTIASLTQSSGVSTFSTQNLGFTKSLTATANTSKAALRTVVVGGTSGSLLYPTSGGYGAPGLYVGDADHSVNSEFNGGVTFVKSAITQSIDSSPRVIAGSDRVGTTYSCQKLTVSRTDPQFMMVTIKMADNLQSNSQPIWLQLHEDFTTVDSRPKIGQSFTITINDIVNNSNVSIGTANWPSVVETTSEDPGLNIMPGYAADGTSGVGKYKIAYINDSLWDGVPADGTSAVNAINSDLLPKGFVRLYNPAQQTGQAGVSEPNPLGASVTLTKVAEETDFSRYVITGGSNFVYVNS